MAFSNVVVIPNYFQDLIDFEQLVIEMWKCLKKDTKVYPVHRLLP